jgi:hypothetical protein
VGSGLSAISKPKWFLVVLPALLLAGALYSCGQTATSEWLGVVRHSDGAPVSGATVQLAGGSYAEGKTGSDGRFKLSPLPRGKYHLTIEAGQRKVDYSPLIELTAASTSVTITLSAEHQITVAAPSEQSGATGGEELSSKQVSQLPLNKRDFSQLLLLAAGTMTDANGATNFTQQFAINGQRGVEATFAMDGADISDPEMGGSTFSNFNVDAVQELQSSSGWMPAEIGRGASGFTNIVTRSGADGFHGSIFEFVRNSAFDARNYFDHPTPAYPGRIPPFRRNEFGFTNGGPVFIPNVYDGRNRTFYFVQYQGFRQVLGTTQVMPVPTAAERSGLDAVNYADGSTDVLSVPVDPGIAAILNRYPLPNDPRGPFQARTYATASSVVTNANQFSIRVDHKISDKGQLFARFNMDNLFGPVTNPDQTAIDPTFGSTYIDHQRNGVITYARAVSPRLILESSISFTRSTPGFPTKDFTDPAIKFNDGLLEGFNGTGGSVIQVYGNLFQARQNFTYIRAQHAIKAGIEVRLNRDTTYFGISPNGEYDFGGGPAYATEAIPSASGNHNLQPGDLLPDTLSSFLSGSPFAYTRAIAPPYFSNGPHIGPAAINRNDVNWYLQDTWKVTPRFTLDYGLRWEFYTPISERALRTSGLVNVNGGQEFVVNPQPGYRTDWNGWEPRVQMAWQVTQKLQAHVGGGIMIIPPNIYQDNFLTGSTPFVVYPRLVSSANFAIPYGFQITPAQLPRVYTPTGKDIFASGNPKAVAPNTVMDVERYEQDVAALTPSNVVSALALSTVDRSFNNATLYTWTAGLERKIGNLTADANYVGTAAAHLPRISYPNAYPGADPAFARYTRFNSARQIVGGFGVENVITATAHSDYHALQASLSGNVGHGGPGIQASYTWGKSIDDTSQVLGSGSTGAVSQAFPQDPFDTNMEKGPSSFDVTHSFGLSLAQDLYLDRVPFLERASKKLTAGWEMLSISTLSSGAPFTVYSGIQQTGAGSTGVDRPDQLAKPHLSTARKNREDYFGEGANNGPDFFSIPVFVPGGTGPNQGRFGTLGRNTFRGPAFYDYDFAFIKDTPFGRRQSGAERVGLQFRAEFFNIFNIVNMGLPSNILGVSTNSRGGTPSASISTTNGFGFISKTAGSSRQIQLSLKLIY